MTESKACSLFEDLKSLAEQCGATIEITETGFIITVHHIDAMSVSDEYESVEAALAWLSAISANQQPQADLRAIRAEEKADRIRNIVLRAVEEGRIQNA